MKRDELNKLIEDEFLEIKVSDELKIKTLKKIEEINNTGISHISYLKNICAVFIVSLICLCAYMNKDSFYLSLEKETENILIEDTSEVLDQNIAETESLSAGQMLKAKSFSNKEKSEISDSRAYLDEAVNDSIEYGVVMRNSYSTPNSMIKEDEFIRNHPGAKKTDKGYIVKENEIEKLYVFENGILLEILEI